MKVSSSYRVRVVVDPVFGERLASLPPGEPVWVIDTPTNTTVAHRLWRERKGENHLTGITTFRGGENLSPEDQAISVLGDVDTHHGEYSANPPYSVLEVIGCADSERLRSALAKFGFHVDASSSHNVVAVRSS